MTSSSITLDSSCIATASMVRVWACIRPVLCLISSVLCAADFLIQSGLAKEVRFHGKRYPWFVSDVTKKDWDWLLNTMVYGHLFPKASEEEKDSLHRLGLRWKVRLSASVSGVPCPCLRLTPAIRERGEVGV